MVEIKIAIERLEAAIGNLSLAGMRRQCNIGHKEKHQYQIDPEGS